MKILTCIAVILLLAGTITSPAIGQHITDMRFGVGPTGLALLPIPTGEGIHATVGTALFKPAESLSIRIHGLANVDPGDGGFDVVGIGPAVEIGRSSGLVRPYGFGGLGVYGWGSGEGSGSWDRGINAGTGVMLGRAERHYVVELGLHHFGPDWGNAGVSMTLWLLSIGLQL